MPKPGVTNPTTTVTVGAITSPNAARPWEDSTLSDQARYDSYLAVAREHVERILEATQRKNLTISDKKAMMADPDNKFWISELRQLKAETPEQFCYRIGEGALRELLGKNFLGAEAWKKGFGVDVGQVPPIPASITQALLDFECPLHPGQKIKDTHVLMLVPKMVNGLPYTPKKLGELCATRKGSGDKLIYDGADSWKRQPWAKLPQSQSEWVLLPKSDPGPSKVSPDKHFRFKNIAAQQAVHDKHYSEYREVEALEVMTMALLYDLTHKERLLPDYLRCEESNASGGRVCVGLFLANGLEVVDADVAVVNDLLGRALARKL